MRDLFIEVIGSIKRNKLRTGLTGFSVAWGIFMLIVLLGAGNGLKNMTSANMRDIEVNTMEIRGGWTSKPYDGLQEGRRIELDDKDVAVTTSELFSEHIKEVSSVANQGTATVSYGKKYFSGALIGTEPHYAGMMKLKMLAGRYINQNDIEGKKKVLVISSGQAETLFSYSDRYDRAIGKRVKVGNASYVIIGVYKTDEQSSSSSIFAPVSTIKAMYRLGNKVGRIIFSFEGLDTEKQNEEFETTYRAVVNKRHRADPSDTRALRISNHFTQNMQMNKGMGIITKALWIVGLFTLLSGIVGVSNIMLIAVKERTHEFGIRKAIGARPWDVTKIIMAESVTITAIFGYIGMFLGMLACEIMSRTVGNSEMDILGAKVAMFVDPTVGLDVALEATLLLIIAGTVAGLVPALKAAKVRPIEALRAD